MGTENTGRAASQAWCAMDDHGYGVQEVTGSKSGGTPFLKVSVSDEIG